MAALDIQERQVGYILDPQPKGESSGLQDANERSLTPATALVPESVVWGEHPVLKRRLVPDAALIW
jgi:hypothetical protein